MNDPGAGEKAGRSSGREAINSRLDEILPPAGEEPGSLHGAMRHSVLSGGKRLRGLLCIEAHRMFGDPDPAAALGAACALELMHAYTLIHDDLPSIDDDDTRRGKPACHVVYGEAVAILAGDALQALAFETLASCGADERLVNECVRRLAVTAGTRFLAGGQVADIEGEALEPTEDRVAFIHLRKTAALLGVSLELGAILAGADDTAVEVMSKTGRDVGLAFQITDDLLDLGGSEDIVGKGLRKDEKRGKITHPAVFGEVRSREIAAGLVRASIARIGDFGNRETLQGLFTLILDRVS